MVLARLVQDRRNLLKEIDDNRSYEDVRPVSYACGCALMVSAAAVDAVGLMDPRYFCYFEEVDWCYRAAGRGTAPIHDELAAAMAATMKGCEIVWP